METVIKKPSNKVSGTGRRPKICLGMPLYNQVQYLPEALNSLLDQTYRNFRLVIVDDSTKPGPGEIAQSFAARDHRITYYKNEYRMGLVDNWKKCFRLAGDADYFAWVGDHDRWHPDWLNSMVQVLETESTVVLVYPKTIHINNDGERRRKKPKPPFSTLGFDDTERVRAVSQDGRGFGKMVYGLFRTAPLRRAGVFRRVLYPDVILLMELSLLGDIHQVDSELWYNRRTENFSTARQKKSLFTNKPWYMALPWPLVNAGVLAWNTAVRSDSEDRLQKKLGYQLTFNYLNRHIRKFGDGSWIGSYHEWRTGKKPLMKRIKRRLRSRDPRRLKMKGSDGSQ